MSDPYKQQARELQEFADIKYTEARAIVCGDRWPDVTVRASKCLVAEWCKLRNLNKPNGADDRVCNCVECQLHAQSKA